jgi:hypothetical protein
MHTTAPIAGPDCENRMIFDHILSQIAVQSRLNSARERMTPRNRCYMLINSVATALNACISCCAVCLTSVVFRQSPIVPW